MIEKRLEVRFFQTEGGAAPVREWLKSLSKEERRVIGEDIGIVQFGWPIGMPVCRPLKKGLYEVRSSLTNRIARVLFIIDGGEMVLLHGFIKKSRATPDADLELARQRQRKWENYA